MATRRSAKSKKVSFNNSSKIVEINQEETVDATINSDGKIVDAEVTEKTTTKTITPGNGDAAAAAAADDDEEVHIMIIAKLGCCC